MSKHTPGPWVAAPYQGFGPFTTVRQGDARTGLRIASTFETTSPEHIDRNEANARLIAASPDHHAVALELDRLMLVIESAVRRQDPSHSEAVVAMLKANRAAIAKATGVEP